MKFSNILFCLFVLCTFSQYCNAVINWSQKGMTYTNDKYCPFVRYNDSKSDLSLYNLRSSGANWVSIVVTNFQDTQNTTAIYPVPGITATDEELEHAINYAHKIGLNVMLKPHIDFMKDPAHWRGEIGVYYTEQQWAEWFANYTPSLVHYAEMAENLKVEQFSLGCELIATSWRDAQWRQVAKSVRDVYSGVLTYAANHGGEETNKTWWDVVDIIGVDAYYPLCPETHNATLADMVNYWNVIMYQGVNNGEEQMTSSLHNLTVFWNKPMIFTELGYCSGNCTTGPEVDLGIQDIQFQSVFEAFANVPWFEGVHWWNWVTDPAFGGEDNWCMTPQFKPTEVLLHEQYGSLYPPIRPNYPAVCPFNGSIMKLYWLFSYCKIKIGYKNQCKFTFQIVVILL
ncbi:hypothetical protein PPL_02386 [Heterostelium album PN500]|uniref:Glycoside hydrolase family 5 domain-containing protein n=1 Tax=Heterostelium pallidum (strain ATCC 26659 / Pp 5 / PN500) TaxID=670386 RepID=D3AZK4_HETP5|nr:hypothetical protein PPL_02386 [Heterostelium album PN500]EFA85383.1 hypothetical protein PPL_02386 [Heterostelium album PN500]|eukprot:XP_020437492.1 hypothetical protein PPL_02386 [Heterostelium album PN500]